jgi:hypothetical protein
LLASENMSGSLGSNWTAITGLSKCQVTGGVSEPNSLSTEAGQIYTGVSFPNDHISEANITLTKEDGTLFQLCVRMQSGSYSGYKCNIGQNTPIAQFYRVDNGSATLLTSTTSGITAPAAGDLWQLAAVGSVLTLYQNGKRILYWADDTYTGGSPGYIQYSTVNVAHNKCLSWRGYNVIQQDGIWSKRGVIIPLAAADIASNGFGRWNVSNIIFEGNAQLLSGMVYKMWFMSGGNSAGNQGQSRYAESADGINWTIRSSPVISNFGIQSLVKVGSTYYAWGQGGTVQGSGAVSAYTSSDGISWSLQNSNFLAVGTGGQWDESGLYIQCNPVIIAGTWYFLYAGRNSSSPVLFKSGIATSPDGITTATKSGSNPVISNSVSGPLIKVGNVFYTWTAGGPGINNWRVTSPFNSAINPAETIRYSSTDMLTWSAVGVRSLHASQLYESVNDINGNATSCIIINIGGVAYNYYVGAPSDSVAPQYYQISLAVGPTTIENIVTANEDGTSQTVTDAFTSGTGDLPATWATPVGGTKLKIVSGNKVEATTTGSYNAMYRAGTFPSDQYSEVTIATLSSATPGAAVMGPMVRVQSGSNSGYVVQLQSPAGTLAAPAIASGILKMTNGAASVIASTMVGTRPAVGDVIRLTVNTVNGLPVLSVYQNGALLQQVVDLANTYTSGNPGMMINTDVLVNSEYSAWAGGNVGVLPPYEPPVHYSFRWPR